MAGALRSSRFMAPLLWTVLLLAVSPGNAFYLPGSYMHTYSQGESISAKVNSLTSIETEMPFNYYSLPYCRPKGGIKKSAENLGELLMGDQIDNSPYQFVSMLMSPSSSALQKGLMRMMQSSLSSAPAIFTRST